MDSRKPADAIVIIGTDEFADDLYYYRAKQLLEHKYGAHLLLPAAATGSTGQTESDEAQAFITATAGPQRGAISVCPDGNDEFRSVDRCLSALHAHSVLMVTPAVESRRWLTLYEKHLPKYSWYVAAVPDPSIFGDHWWSNREWAKNYVEALQKLIYAELKG